MSGDRTPSPNESNGFRRPQSRKPGQRKNFGPDSTPTWAGAQERSAKVNGLAKKDGFFGKHFRSLSTSLPRFQGGGKDYSEKEKLGRGRSGGWSDNLGSVVTRAGWRLRIPLTILGVVVMTGLLFFTTPLGRSYQRSAWFGGGSKYVIVLGANQGGGVMEWKGPREWAIERDSVRNKKAYAAKWGYELEIVDMATKKRYAHEWRESWEKVDTLKKLMHKYPHAEWFWWLDLNTYIMEPSISLQSHIFNNLAANTYRNLNDYNPLGLQHPLDDDFLDPITRSPTGDNKSESINMIIPQDCGGFNLGSFFVRRSDWTDRVLDIWWDPVHYEQRHMQWEHKEQDAFEYLYDNQPWIRPHVAFIQQRKINSFPPGACGDGGNKTIHYSEQDRDFVVSMAGCEWGRDCWGEMFNYRELSLKLNRSRWQKLKLWWEARVKKAEEVAAESKSS